MNRVSVLEEVLKGMNNKLKNQEVELLEARNALISLTETSGKTDSEIQRLQQLLQTTVGKNSQLKEAFLSLLEKYKKVQYSFTVYNLIR